MSRESGCAKRRRKAIENREREAKILRKRTQPLAAAFDDVVASASKVQRAMRNVADILAMTDGAAR